MDFTLKEQEVVNFKWKRVYSHERLTVINLSTSFNQSVHLSDQWSPEGDIQR